MELPMLNNLTVSC